VQERRKRKEKKKKKHRHDFRANLAIVIRTPKLGLVNVDQFNQSLTSPSLR
jgi:hypothetical protein